MTESMLLNLKIYLNQYRNSIDQLVASPELFKGIIIYVNGYVMLKNISNLT